MPSSDQLIELGGWRRAVLSALGAALGGTVFVMVASLFVAIALSVAGVGD